MSAKPMRYAAAREDGCVYYADDGAWWMIRTDASDTDRQSVLLLDVLVGVTDQMRALVIADNERMTANDHNKINHSEARP